MASIDPGVFFTPFERAEWSGKKRSLLRYYNGVRTPYLAIITGGVANDPPGATQITTDEIDAADKGSGLWGKAIFRGGQSWVVTAAEEAALTTAGWTLT